MKSNPISTGCTPFGYFMLYFVFTIRNI